MSDTGMHLHGPGDRTEEYTPERVPDGINMALEDWAALSDVQRKLVGDRRFARPVTPEMLAESTGAQ